MILQDAGNDSQTAFSSNEDSNYIDRKVLYDSLIDVTKKSTFEPCIRRKFGWKQLRLHIIVIRKFKQGLKESKETTSNELTNDRDNGEESKFNQSCETRSNGCLSIAMRIESKSNGDDTSADSSIHSDFSLKSDENDIETAKAKYFASAEWKQIRLRASGTNIFNEIKETIAFSPESLKRESYSTVDHSSSEVNMYNGKLFFGN